MDDLVSSNPNALLADGFEAAFMGYVLNYHHAHVAVYNSRKCIRILMSGGMDEEMANEYFSFNVLDSYVGDNGPLFVDNGGL